MWYFWVGLHSLNISSRFQSFAIAGYKVISITMRQGDFLKSQLALNHAIHFHKSTVTAALLQRMSIFTHFFLLTLIIKWFTKIAMLLWIIYFCSGSWKSEWSIFRFPFHSHFRLSSLQWFWNLLNLYLVSTLDTVLAILLSYTLT